MMDESADPRLIALMLTGDQKAFATLIERYQFMAQRLAVQLTGNQEVARELVQEAIVQAYLSLDRLRDTTRFKSWFYGIVLNVCRGYLRTQKLRAVSLEALIEGQAIEELNFPDAEVD
ncbi:MAG: sigma factor, partial [Ktedonobacteraceae bacterium]